MTVEKVDDKKRSKRMRMDKNQQELIYIHPFINDCKRSVPKSRTLKKPTDPDSCGPPFEKVKVPKQGNLGPTKGPAGARRCPNFPVRGLLNLLQSPSYFIFKSVFSFCSKI